MPIQDYSRTVSSNVLGNKYMRQLESVVPEVQDPPPSGAYSPVLAPGMALLDERLMILEPITAPEVQTDPDLPQTEGSPGNVVSLKSKDSALIKVADQATGEIVVVKFFKDSYSAAIRRTNSEIAANLVVSGLPNIVEARGAAAENISGAERRLLVSRYMAKGPLTQSVETAGPMSEDQTIAMAHGIANGLAHAHALGVSHQDVMPGNIVEGENDEWALVDWGVAQRTRRELTPALSEALGAKVIFWDTIEYEEFPGVSGVTWATANYAAPERLQVYAEERKEAGDVYSLGMVVHYALTGKGVFDLGKSPTLSNYTQALADAINSTAAVGEATELEPAKLPTDELRASGASANLIKLFEAATDTPNNRPTAAGFRAELEAA